MRINICESNYESAKKLLRQFANRNHQMSIYISNLFGTKNIINLFEIYKLAMNALHVKSYQCVWEDVVFNVLIKAMDVIC